MARTVKCVMLGKDADGLDFAPYPGDLGQRIYDNVSKEEMEKFFFGGGSAAPKDFVPPTD